ncbi:Glucokinase [Tetrabaena socialis]|uniref:Glucokinase n=1 Tax=Tetrabaena socialis TaxID=47790 RepID=A0A2J8ADQ5_9CHLO|nr:Glucokinase [Tetrabaena socialis]|eukprot:PNH10636.1 Glucokinase [Tetrabaena socialis]
MASEADDSPSTSSRQQAVVLVGDVGGTNARLSTWRTDLSSAAASELFAKTYPTSLYSTFEAVMEAFLAEPAVQENPPAAAALAIAGAVDNNRCEMTNVSWLVDGAELTATHGFQVALLNDFEAVGYGIPVLQPEDLITLNDVPVHLKAPKVVMGPGTGLGAAQLMWDTGLEAYKVWPGEGSHATFAPRGWKQKALARHVTTKFGHCEIEQVACGPGLELIYEFLQTDEIANRPHLLSLPPQPVSARAGGRAGAATCCAASGVYIAGGITPKLLPRIKEGSLLEGFLMRNGRQPFHRLLMETPLFVITNGKVGQMGAREVAKRLLPPAA